MSVIEYVSGIMPVTSVLYLVFLALAVAVFYALRGAKARSGWLLLTSLVFYALMSPRSLLVLVALTALAYGTGIALGRPEGRRRRVLVGASVSVLVASLAFFKFSAQLLHLLALVPQGADLIRSSPALAIAMPVGISFWTFQLIAYLVDIYRGHAEPVRDPLKMLLAVVFFPIVTIGPITKVGALTEQFEKVRRFDFDRMRSALLLMGWGFFKKLVIADRLAVFVASVFGNVRGQGGFGGGLIFFIAAAFFAIQLYADFSGYTDIVRGSARLIGVDLPQNFAAPYFSRSIAEFWRRWHMTLMDWLRHYVYFPLGGNRKGPIRKKLNTLAVFLVSGLWHGVGLTFVVWGLLNGAYMVIGEMTAPLRERFLARIGVDSGTAVHRTFQRVVTFALVTVAWVFFRAASISDALYIVPRMFVPSVWVLSNGAMLKQGLSGVELLIAAVAVVMLFAVDYLRYERGIDVSGWLTSQFIVFRWLVYYGLILVVVVFGYYGGSGSDASSFLYFRF